MLTKENKTALTTFIDDLIEFNGILEMIDGLAIGAALTALDNKVFDEINPVYHNVINEIVSHIFAEEYEPAKDKLSILLADVITTPFVDGTAEEIALYNQVLTTLLAIVENLLAKQSEV